MKTLQRVSQFLSTYTSIFIILIAIVTFVFPEIFFWVRGDIQSLVLGVIMLSMGMTLSTDDFKILVSRPLDIVVGVVAQYSLMPMIAFAMTKFFHLDPAIGIGLILVGCCPGGVSSNIMSFLCKGDVAFSVGMTTVTTLMSPIMTPMLVLALAGESIDVDALGMFKTILFVTLMPVAIGFTLNYVFGKKENFCEFRKVMPGISVIGLACIVGGVVAFNGDKFFTSGLLIFIAIFFHNSLGYVCGYIIGKSLNMGKAKNRTIAIEVGMQNAGLATNLASKHFAALPEAAVASAVSCVWHSISGTILANLFVEWDNFRKKQKGETQM
ncbi:MAG: bile acid:sodium symporter family protein [Bacteroidales bacterium]|nr:bile acid:sodium symporter family protein [Bacteroidales bacterium]